MARWPGSPTQGSGTPFLIGGNDGDPQESGVGFTAPTNDPSAGAGPSDTLLVFGKLVPGNRDLESSPQIGAIFNNTSLSVTYPFNPNDDSGRIGEQRSVIPYVIGHAED